MEVLIVGILIIFVFVYNKWINTSKFFTENKQYFKILKEDDYDFLVQAKYGDKVDPDLLFQARLKNTFIIFAIVFLVLLSKLTFLFIIIMFAITIGYFKLSYINLKTYYRKHLHDIDLLLPYYLKSLEILIQHYTVPVALSKSFDSAPAIFKEGLRELIASINAGDSTIDPYMAFARKYPVRDSMRMMRLLYRLGLGNQERKQDQLIVFSKTISNLQSKARDIKYKERLEKMEKRTMVMLSVTGVGVMVLLIISIMQIFQF